jgi:hypothetical protein
MAVQRGHRKIYREDGLTIEGDRCKVFGRGCKVKGNYNEIIGDDCTSDGIGNHIKGFNCRSDGPRNIIYSDDCIETNGMGNKHKVETTDEAKQRKGQHIDNMLRGLIVIHHFNPAAAPSPAPLPAAALPTGPDQTTDDVTKQCVVCLDNEKVCAPDACGHRCLCISCSKKITDRKCPLCRRRFAKITKIFL